MRSRVAWSLREWGIAVFDLFCRIATKVDGVSLDSPSESEQSRQSFSIMTTIRLRKEHPCPTCKGECVLLTETGDDFYPCQSCKGSGLDLAYLLEKEP